MKKIILVFAGKKDFHKPEIPMAVISFIPYLKDKGFNVEVFDSRVSDLNELNLEDVLFVGFSTVTGPQIKYSLEVAKYIREKNPKIPLIWGGAHPSLLPEQTLRNRYVDIIVRGEGEITAPELAIALRDNSSLHEVKGIFFKEEGKIVSTGLRGLMDMKNLKCPAYDSIDINKYQAQTMPYFISRGCPHRCRFCCESTYGQGRTYRMRDTNRIIEDLKYLVKEFNPEVINFFDDNVLANRTRVKEICKAILKEKLNIKYSVSCRFDYVANADEEFLQLLKDSGCICLRLGGESGSQATLDYINKDVQLSEMVKGIEIAQKYGIEPHVSFMLGFPKETKEDILKTMHFIDMLVGICPKTNVNGIFIFTPFLGNELFDEAVESGFKVPNDFLGWSVFSLGKIIDIPWLSFTRKYYILTIEYISRLPFIRHKGGPKYGGHKKLPFLQEMIYRFYVFDARFRWKHKFFSFGIEWWLLYLVRKNYNI